MNLIFKRLLISLVTFVVIGFSSFSFASQLRFVAEDLPPFHYYDKNNRPTGALVEVIEELMVYSKLSYKIELMPFARIFDLTSKKQNVIMVSLMKSSDRINNFKWIGQSYKSKAFLVGLKDRTDININELEQAKSFVVGTIRGYHSERYLKDAGFTTQKNLHLSVNYKHMWKMLFEQRIDFVLTNYVAIEREINSVGLNQKMISPIIELQDFPGGLYLATSLSTSDITVNALSDALIHIKENGTYEKIMNKWGL
jgi:polar amino acid transport system substrate-binding protein